MGEKIFLQDNADGCHSVIMLTAEQRRLLDWLITNGWTKDDVEYTLLCDMECIEI